MNEYADMTLEELEAANKWFRDQIQELKANQRELLPYLDAAWREQNKADAAKADPNLTQGVG